MRSIISEIIKVANIIKKATTWKKYKSNSGETWEKSQVFNRVLMWDLTLDRNYKQIAKLLDVPEDLLKSDIVKIRIQSDRKIKVAYTAVDIVEKKILKLFNNGFSEEEIIKKLKNEDADLVGEAWSNLVHKKLIKK